MKLKTILLLIVLALGFSAISIAQSTYIKIGDIKGDSADREHKEWIVIESMSNLLEKQIASTGVTRRRSSVNFADYILTKKLDKSTPKLMEACAKGQVMPKAELVLVAQNGRTYYKVTLENVMITGIRTFSHCDPNCEVREEVALNYSKITWEYTASNGEKVISTYNVRTGN